jgi:hypothetical protein
MRWEFSNALISTFKKKYAPVLEKLGYEFELCEQLVRHVGGLERSVVISIFREGSIMRRHLVIVEVKARDSTHWVRVASDYNGAGVVRTKLDEVLWKSFYVQCNKLIEGCIRDLLPKGSVKFSLSGGLELSIDGEKIAFSLDQLAELPKVAALSSL